MFLSWRTRDHLYWLLGLAGVFARLWLMSRTLGTDDIFTWQRFATDIRANGLFWAYRSLPDFNHPPLMGLWSVLALRIGTASGLGYAFAFKLLPFAADLVSAWLLFAYVRRNFRSPPPAAVAAFFLANPISILVTGFHGNTDSVLASLCLGAALLARRNKLFGAGLALGAAINVKILPAVLVLPLLISSRSFRDLGLLVSGLALMAIPFLPTLTMVREPFVAHVLNYNSVPGRWGIPFILDEIAAIHHSPVDATVSETFCQYAKFLILGGSALNALLARRKGRHAQVRICAFGLTLALVLTPGFGYQYLVWSLPLLFALDSRRAMWTSLVGGVFLGSMYLHFWAGTWPAYSDCYKWPTFGVVLAFLVWVLLAKWSFTLWQGDWRQNYRRT
jgi:hypothetical protein